MRNKKLLSTVVATAMIATMAMPVMAADEGEVDVDVSTRTAVIRVKVPTSLEVAVNQFEKGDAGSQIYSAKFGVENMSEIPVKLTVDSKVTLDASDPITLVTTKNAAEKSAADDAWLAVAAETSDGNYIAESGKTIKDLTEASGNVTTFAQGSGATASEGTAQQVFYLDANATPTVTYKKLTPTTAANDLADAKATSYAQIYEVEAVDFTSASDAAAKQAVLDGKISAGDVYAEGASTITLIEKGKAASYADGTNYYSVKAPVLSKDLVVDKIYIYGEAAVGGKTGFRYIGKLSEGKETWTEDDISNINIKYNIKGVTTTNYTEAAKNCAYGLYTAPKAPSITSTKAVAAGSAAELAVDLGAGSKGASGVASVTSEALGDTNLLDLDGDIVVYEDGTLTFTSVAVDFLLGESTLTWPLTFKVTFTMNDSNAEAAVATFTLTK